MTVRWMKLSPAARRRIVHRQACKGGDWWERTHLNLVTAAGIVVLGFVMVGASVAAFATIQQLKIYWIAVPVFIGWVLVVFGICYITRRKT